MKPHLSYHHQNHLNWRGQIFLLVGSVIKTILTNQILIWIERNTLIWFVELSNVLGFVFSSKSFIFDVLETSRSWWKVNRILQNLRPKFSRTRIWRPKWTSPPKRVKTHRKKIVLEVFFGSVDPQLDFRPS